MAAEGRVTLNRGGRNSRFDCMQMFPSMPFTKIAQIFTKLNKRVTEVKIE